MSASFGTTRRAREGGRLARVVCVRVTPNVVGCDCRTAYVRLTAFEERNLVTSRKVGTTLAWEPAEEE